jgi:hypothetical protein
MGYELIKDTSRTDTSRIIRDRYTFKEYWTELLNLVDEKQGSKSVCSMSKGANGHCKIWT